jgi:hypothetical protein
VADSGLWPLLAHIAHFFFVEELELELTQTHMTQKPLLWVEAGAHAVR